MTGRRLHKIQRRVARRLADRGALVEAEIVARMSRPELVTLARLEGWL